MVAVHLYKPELKQLPALTCYFLTSMKSSSASLVGLNEKPDRWISCLLLLFSLHCSEETCGHLFLLELCTSSFFNSCSITEKKPAALETPATKSFSAEINVPIDHFSCSFFLNPRQTTLSCCLLNIGRRRTS